MAGTLTLFLVLAAPVCPPGQAGPPPCADALPVMEAGCAVRWVCADAVEAEGLTRLDLSDAWTPTLLTEDPSLGEAGIQPYRSIYLKLAAGRVTDAEVEGRARVDEFLEPYGIFPNFSVLRARITDEERHACRAKVKNKPLLALTRRLSPYEDPKSQKARIKAVDAAEARFTKELMKRNPDGPKPGVAEFEALGEEKKWAAAVARWQKSRARVAAIEAMQAHLRCDRLTQRPDPDGFFGWDTQLALEKYQRKQMLGGRSHLDLETRDYVVMDSRELDFRALLRALRERVGEAGGIIEDGSALGEPRQVFGRDLDSAEYRHPLADVPLKNGVEDFLSPATEAAATALGWTSPEAAAEAMPRLGDLAGLAVAVKLPPRPPWQSAHMELRAEVDRGDVWYDYPIGPSGKRRSQPVSRRPTLTLFAQHQGKEIALFHWPTTIGSWKEEREEDGSIVYKYKNSDVGPRVWRSLVATPSWLPPPSTPDDDIVQPDGRGGYRAKTELLGPSYASAYGLVMLIHHKPVTRRDGTVVYFDNGIRAHGSVSYRTIIRGASHGCHRLFNHLAVRLGDYLLKHRTVVREGNLPVRYGRTVNYKGENVSVKIESRGHGFLLEPPVPVEVLEGRIRGRVRQPPKGSRAVP
ncbi:MAG: hypothetical protein R3F60_23465 [bacterium]